MSDDLLTSAAIAVETYFSGENKTRRSIRFDMEALRAVVHAEQKRRIQEDTAILTRPEQK